MAKRKMACSIDEDLTGWLDFNKSRVGVSASSYLSTLAQEDRDRAAESDPETWRAYIKFLEAVGRKDELKLMRQEHAGR